MNENESELFDDDLGFDSIDGTETGWRKWLLFTDPSNGGVKMCSAWHPFGEWPDERFSAECVPAFKPRPGAGRVRRYLNMRKRVSCGSAPNPDCTCGIYAFKTREGAEMYGSRSGQVGHIPDTASYTLDALRERSRGIVGLVLGRIELWGEVLDCEDHWRGEYAYAQELFIVRGDAAFAEILSERYRIPVTGP